MTYIYIYKLYVYVTYPGVVHPMTGRNRPWGELSVKEKLKLLHQAMADYDDQAAVPGGITLWLCWLWLT